MEKNTDQVVAHYSSGELMPRIRAALTRAGADPNAPTLAQLSQLDQLHGGGLAATKIMFDIIGVSKGSHVLDAGCGVGGPSRYLADALGCTVDAIDITPEYVEVAAALNAAVGLQDKITLAVGSVTDLPYDDQVFDVAISQNVTMNVADKTAMFAEMFRVLKPGAVLAISHHAQGPAGAPHYPLPFARAADAAFLETPEIMFSLLADAGFLDITNRMKEAVARGSPPVVPAAASGGPAEGDGVAMGDDMPARSANIARSAKEGRLVSLLIIAKRPA
ncbi:MAG: methyltransferase domain-containing protein [Rhodobacteraceae bacterium]|nr:methyltransferase domain-containing protein [Paracoccaceae bacterium]